MPNIKEQFLKPAENLRNLQLLEEIAKDSDISQRKLSQQLGIALGVTNACLKKMVTKGLVKVNGINHKRIAYYLTPAGFTEKAQLTYHFLQHTVRFYSALKDNISVKLSALAQDGHQRIMCYGAGEVMEVVCIILNETRYNFSVLGIVDDDENKQGRSMFGLKVMPVCRIKELKPDAVLITSIKYKDEIMNRLMNNCELSGMHFYSF